jgi:prepilin-type N-terminal cleavage/methylation domain-containing protein
MRLARKAFTLFEIMIVVVVIGILAAVIIPNFASGANDARHRVAETFGKTLETGSSLYVSQFGRVPTSFYNWVAYSEGGSTSNIVRVDSQMRRELADHNQNVMLNSGTRLELRFPGGMVARYDIDSTGKITTTITE